jgi:hypothetical protein
MTPHGKVKSLIVDCYRPLGFNADFALPVSTGRPQAGAGRGPKIIHAPALAVSDTAPTKCRGTRCEMEFTTSSVGAHLLPLSECNVVRMFVYCPKTQALVCFKLLTGANSVLLTALKSYREISVVALGSF